MLDDSHKLKSFMELCIVAFEQAFIINEQELGECDRHFKHSLSQSDGYHLLSVQLAALEYSARGSQELDYAIIVISE